MPEASGNLTSSLVTSVCDTDIGGRGEGRDIMMLIDSWEANDFSLKSYRLQFVVVISRKTQLPNLEEVEPLNMEELGN